MKKVFHSVILLLLFFLDGEAQQYRFQKEIIDDSSAWQGYMQRLSEKLLTNTFDSVDLFRAQITAGKYKQAISTIQAFRKSRLLYIQYELYAQAAAQKPFNETFSKLFTDLFSGLEDKDASYFSTAFLSRYGIADLQTRWLQSLQALGNRDSINLPEATSLVRAYNLWHIYRQIEPISRQLLHEDDQRRYIIEDSVLIKTPEGITLSATVVRKRSLTLPAPATLFFTIYTDPYSLLTEAKESAARGYVGVVADARGKRLSPDAIEPFETEGKDANAVIDWMSRQPWSNGKIGMYGGSYVGFVQWAAAKYHHPALKTIVPYVAAIPGQGLPMENNVFLTANYQWNFYVMNNKQFLDNEVNNDWQRWDRMRTSWYRSGVAYRKLDSVDGTPNKIFQRQLNHPSYDKYWQQMVPYKEQYAEINIPVLTITGYYDDGQISALHYLKEHYKYNKKANHYLVIGPYDHFGAQTGGYPVLRGYTLDPTALISTRDITFAWFDHVLRGGPKPAILKDKINYEVMGANEWRSAPSIEKMHDTLMRFYFSDTSLVMKKPSKPGFILQQVDLADRTTMNNDYYPGVILSKEINRSNGLFFISEPFDKPVSVNGCFSGIVKATINKKDMDIGIVLYEVTPSGEYFHLAYYLGRASYAQDMSKRKLLTPGKPELIPYSRSRMTGRQLSKGSRLLVVLNINKNAFAQVNYGTGKDVSDETIADAGAPLQIKWHNDSYIDIPLSWR
jgi:putative CocE/NonD family hydrolase